MAGPVSSQIIGRYAIYGKIASGGMASVHFGRMVGAAGFTRTVAVKRLHSHIAEDPEFMSTMIDEARLAARIHHPNVTPTLDVVASHGELLVVMEYVRGESLGRLLRAEAAREQRIPLPVASAIIVGALHGLHAAHEATDDRGEPLGIVHRDVSPQNILVGADGQPRIIDFGVAKAAGRLQTTRKGVVKGKMGYMAPEQLAAKEVTRRADVYSMAVILWEVLAGRRIFKAEGDAALFGMVLAGAKEPPSRHAPDVQPDLDALVMKGLALEPADRFASAREMADALTRILPPAFPPDVGAWVEDVASDSLAKHKAVLADIESRSDIALEPTIPDAAPTLLDAAPPTAPGGRGDVRESEDSRIAVSPASVPVASPPKTRLPLVAAVGGSVLVVAAVIVFAAHKGAPAATVAPPPSASAPPVAVPPPLPTEPAPAPPPPAATTAAPTAALSASPRPPATATAAAHAASHAASPRASPKPAASIRFTQPD